MGAFKAKDEFVTGAKKRLVISAKVAGENTPQTDAMPLVDHVVVGEVDGVEFEVIVSARDPLWAMSLVSAMSEEDFAQLKRADTGVAA